MDRPYCGTRIPIPSQYSRPGNAYECLRKGVGVGKNLPPTIKKSYNITYILIYAFFGISIILNIILLIIILHKIDSNSSKDKK